MKLSEIVNSAIVAAARKQERSGFSRSLRNAIQTSLLSHSSDSISPFIIALRCTTGQCYVVFTRKKMYISLQNFTSVSPFLIFLRLVRVELKKSWTFQQRRDGVTRTHSTPCKNLQTSSTTKHFRCGLRPVVTLLHFFSPGDILGSSLNNLDKLLRMPYGCGEQNMINFAPNIYVMKYLKTVNQLTDQMERKAKNFMISGQC